MIELLLGCYISPFPLRDSSSFTHLSHYSSFKFVIYYFIILHVFRNPIKVSLSLGDFCDDGLTLWIDAPVLLYTRCSFLVQLYRKPHLWHRRDRQSTVDYLSQTPTPAHHALRG